MPAVNAGAEKKAESQKTFGCCPSSQPLKKSTRLIKSAVYWDSGFAVK